MATSRKINGISFDNTENSVIVISKNNLPTKPVKADYFVLNDASFYVLVIIILLYPFSVLLKVFYPFHVSIFTRHDRITKAFMLCGLTEVSNHFIFIRLHLCSELWVFKYPHRHKCSPLPAIFNTPIHKYFVNFCVGVFFRMVG